MTSGRGVEAHALSLHIYAIMDRGDQQGSNRSQIISELQGFLHLHHLESDLDVVSRDGARPGVAFTTKTLFGEEMVEQLAARCEFFPCPEGECEYATGRFCKWCGNVKG